MTVTAEIRLALANLVTIQRGLVIDDPRRINGCHAFTFFPPEQQTLPEPACWINEVTLTRVRHQAASDRHSWWTVRSQLLVQDAQLPQAIECALEFYEKFLSAIEADLTLGGTISGAVSIEGGTPTGTVLNWNGKAYGGLHLVLGMQFEKAVTLAA